MTSRGGDGWPGGNDRRHGYLSGTRRDRGREVRAVAEVPHGRDAGAQRPAGGDDHRVERLIVGPGGQRTDRIGARVEDQMHVDVDEPGEQRHTRQVDDGDAVGRRDRPVLDGDDARPVEHDGRVREEAVTGLSERGIGAQEEQTTSTSEALDSHALHVRRDPGCPHPRDYSSRYSNNSDLHAVLGSDVGPDVAL